MIRKPKSETVAEFRDEFLAGKSEEYKEKFNQKSLDQQYSAIANWKNSAKNLGNATKDLAKVTASTVISYLKDAHKKLQKLETLSPKETEKIHNMLNTVKDTVENFTPLKKQQLIKELQDEKVRLAKQNEEIDRQIQSLQNELAQ